MATVLMHCLATAFCVAFSFRSDQYLAPLKDGGMFGHCLATTIHNNFRSETINSCATISPSLFQSGLIRAALPSNHQMRGLFCY